MCIDHCSIRHYMSVVRGRGLNPEEERGLHPWRAPVNRMIGTCLWKHYLPLRSGKNAQENSKSWIIRNDQQPVFFQKYNSSQSFIRAIGENPRNQCNLAIKGIFLLDKWCFRRQLSGEAEEVQCNYNWQTFIFTAKKLFSPGAWFWSCPSLPCVRCPDKRRST